MIGTIAKKGRVLGQSFDGFVLLPLPVFEMIYGRRKTNTVSVKMPSALLVASGMERANEAMRISHRLRPGDDFKTVHRDKHVGLLKVAGFTIVRIVSGAATFGACRDRAASTALRNPKLGEK